MEDFRLTISIQFASKEFKITLNFNPFYSPCYHKRSFFFFKNKFKN